MEVAAGRRMFLMFSFFLVAKAWTGIALVLASEQETT